MSQPIITVEGLAKRYTLTHLSKSDTLSSRLGEAIRAPGRWFRGGGHPTRPSQQEDFWALKDVNFSVNQGEVVGIIGRNGAGKSTLLKILSRITAPTQGRITLRGRVASLLEVGTGFHPELTGRENIFLNGAILGMNRAEIRQKFDQIVEFAEVAKFIDTPVKHYSSGMYVRLAFAVAAHLEPEILIVDEVLAVGDMQFQQKCLGRMEQVSRGEGRTVLFVSHNLAAVRQLCQKGILLSSGSVISSGAVGQVLDYYQSKLPVKASFSRATERPGAEAEILEVCLRDMHGHLVERFNSNERIFVDISVRVAVELPPCQLAVRVSTVEGIPVLTTTNGDASGELTTLSPGRHLFSFELPSYFSPGLYGMKLALCLPQRKVYDAVDDEIRFEITMNNSLVSKFMDDRKGVVVPSLPWIHSKT